MSVATKGALTALLAVVCALGLLASAGSALAEMKTFTYTGKEQEFKLPPGVTAVHVVAIGSGGGATFGGTSGGLGAIVTGELSVKPEQVLYVEVGGVSFNGGGAAGAGGGGASDVRTVSIGEVPSPGNEASLKSRLLVAGGGGGAGAEGAFSTGGVLGGTGGSAAAGALGVGGAGENGEPAFGGGGGEGGKGATTTEGGKGGSGGGGAFSGEPGRAGALGAGGGGGGSPLGTSGGGGGGGLYGGGAGGGAGTGSSGELGGSGGGGGGSNLVPTGGEAKLAKAGEATSVTFTYAAIHPTATSAKCAPQPVAAGQSTTCTTTVEDTAASRASSPTGTVGFKSSGPGSFEGACRLKSASTSSSSCSVTYKPSSTPKAPERTDTITTTYEGDQSHLRSGDTTRVTVISPVATTITSRSTMTTSSTSKPAPSECPPASGRLSGASLGALELGLTRPRALAKLQHVSISPKGFQDFCLRGGPGISAGYAGRRLLRYLPGRERASVRGRIVILLTANPFYALQGAHPGMPFAAVSARLHAVEAFQHDGNHWYVVPGKRINGVVMVRGGKISFVGIAKRLIRSGRPGLFAVLKLEISS